MATLDGDAARAARSEAEQEPKTVILGGRVYDLPNELPARTALALLNGDWPAALTALLNGQAEAFLDEASDKDLEWFAEALGPLYVGASEGESSASGTSSKKSSRSSRQPSSASTKST